MADEEKAATRKSSARNAEGGGGIGDTSALDEAQEKGYIGERPDSEYDKSEYSLQTGPASPPYPLGKE